MATEPRKITAKNVDSFNYDSRRVKGSQCAFVGCKKTGTVKLFWREDESGQHYQQVNWICVAHALALANEVLSEYKFGHELAQEASGSVVDRLLGFEDDEISGKPTKA